MKEPNHICELCGKPFYRIQVRGHAYCSQSCYWKAKSQKVECICLICGKAFKRSPSIVQKGNVKYCSKKCQGIDITGENHPKYQGGTTADGYHIVRFQGKAQRMHRLIIEAHVGRKLRKNEIVHHIDRNRSNNDISNLMVMTRSDHAALHAREDGY